MAEIFTEEQKWLNREMSSDDYLINGATIVLRNLIKKMGSNDSDKNILKSLYIIHLSFMIERRNPEVRVPGALIELRSRLSVHDINYLIERTSSVIGEEESKKAFDEVQACIKAEAAAFMFLHPVIKWKLAGRGNDYIKRLTNKELEEIINEGERIRDEHNEVLSEDTKNLFGNYMIMVKHELLIREMRKNANPDNKQL